MTEHEILVEETKQESTDAKVWLGAYTKQKLLNFIKEFPELKHPLPVYRFLYWTGEVFSTINLSEFAQLHGCGLAGLHIVQTKSNRSCKGLIKCPEEVTSNLKENKAIYNKLTFSKSSARITDFFNLENK